MGINNTDEQPGIWTMVAAIGVIVVVIAAVMFVFLTSS
jgi:hypothetical protein